MPALLIIIMILIWIGCFFWYNHDWDNFWGPVLVAGMTLVIGATILVVDYAQAEHRTVVVEGKDRGGDDGSYRVYTDGDTLAVKDAHIPGVFWRTDSADVFGDIPVCHKLEITVRGWESGFMSLMPNIDEIVEDHGPVENYDECMAAATG